MKRKALIVGIMVVAGWLGVSTAHEQHAKHLPDSKDVIAFRTYLMENIGDNAKELNDKIKAGKIKERSMRRRLLCMRRESQNFFLRGVLLRPREQKKKSGRSGMISSRPRTNFA